MAPMSAIGRTGRFLVMKKPRAVVSIPPSVGDFGPRGPITEADKRSGESRLAARKRTDDVALCKRRCLHRFRLAVLPFSRNESLLPIIDAHRSGNASAYGRPDG